MDAVEKLTAAIKRLKTLKAERGYLEDRGWLVEQNPNDRYWREPAPTAQPEPFIPITNDEIFVTLHRTIDAQLEILREGKSQARGAFALQPAQLKGALALADAILGGV